MGLKQRGRKETMNSNDLVACSLSRIEKVRPPFSEGKPGFFHGDEEG